MDTKKIDRYINFLILAQVLDVISTYIIVGALGIASEGNPIALLFMTIFGVLPGLIIIKLPCLLLLFIRESAKKHNGTMLRFALKLVSAIYMIVLINNFGILLYSLFLL